MPLETVQKWLTAGSVLIIVSGLMIAAASMPSLSAPLIFLVDLVIWPLDGAQHIVSVEHRLMVGILGGVLIGWGVLLLMITRGLLAEHPQVARRLVLTSIVMWFVVDSTASVAAGAPINALVNLIYLLVFAWPLRRPVGPSRSQLVQA